MLGGFLFLILVGVGAFVRQTYIYYRAIKSGQVNPLLDRQMESSWTRLQANTHVTSADLARLVPEGAPTLGSPNGGVTMVEFIDFDCPFSRESFGPVREIMQKYQDKVRLVIRDFPLEELHPNAMRNAQAARCANAQGKYWAYHDKLFGNPDQHEETDLKRFAREVGMDGNAFDTCLASMRDTVSIQQDLADGLQAGVEGTPTFFFNGLRVQGGLDAATLEFLIQKSLENPPKSL